MVNTQELARFEPNMPAKTIANLKAALDARRAEMVLPKWAHTTIEVIYGTAYMACQEKPAILTCPLDTIILAVAKGCRYGVSFSKELGEAHLIPQRRKGVLRCEFRWGYHGLEKMAYRTCQVTSICSGVVYEGDEFDYQLGTGGFIKHQPTGQVQRDNKHKDKVTHSWALAHMKDGGWIPEVMDRAEINEVMAVSRAKEGPWIDWFAAQARKSAIIRLCKHLPKSPEQQDLFEVALKDYYATEGLAATARASATLDPTARAQEYYQDSPRELPVVEGEVVQPEAEGVPPSQPPQEATPPAPDALRSQITDLCALLVEKAKEEGKPITTATLVETASKQTLKKVLGLGQMDAAQLSAVRDRLVKWCGEKGIKT